MSNIFNLLAAHDGGTRDDRGRANGGTSGNIYVGPMTAFSQSRGGDLSTRYQAETFDHDFVILLLRKGLKYQFHLDALSFRYYHQFIIARLF